MSIPSCPDEFSRRLDEDITWRRREISDLNGAIRLAPPESRISLCRAMIPMIYAHWEGFVIGSAKLYFQYISRRRLDVSKLSYELATAKYIPQINAFQKLDMPGKQSLVSELLRGGVGRFSSKTADAIGAGGNLNSDRLRDLLCIIGIDPLEYTSESLSMDTALLKRRNEIAHGSWVMANSGEIQDLSGRVFNLMTRFSDDIQNAVVLEKYKR